LLAGYLLPRLFAHFLAAHPEIEIEVDLANRNVDLTRREADLALRATNQPPEILVGRRIAVMRYAVYAARSLLPPRGRTPVLEELPWVGFDERIAHFDIARWFSSALPRVRPRLRFDSMPALLKAAAAGAGAVVLPTFAASQEPALIRVTPPIERPQMGLWLLNHPDVRGNARVRALSDFLFENVPGELARLGEAGATCKQFAACPVARRRASRTRKAGG
jgi:DNA-binding transcriptional LysR family regulator